LVSLKKDTVQEILQIGQGLTLAADQPTGVLGFYVE